MARYTRLIDALCMLWIRFFFTFACAAFAIASQGSLPEGFLDDQFWRIRVGGPCVWDAQCASDGIWVVNASMPLFQKPSSTCGASDGLPSGGVPTGTSFWWVRPCSGVGVWAHGGWCYDTAAPPGLNDGDVCACLVDDGDANSVDTNWIIGVSSASPWPIGARPEGAAPVASQPAPVSSLHVQGASGITIAYLPPEYFVFRGARDSRALAGTFTRKIVSHLPLCGRGGVLEL